jgi:hypothetical protein
MTLAEDQKMIEAFTAHGADETFGERVGPRRRLHPIPTIDADGCG